MSKEIVYDDKSLQEAVANAQSYLQDPKDTLEKSAAWLQKEIKKVFSEEGPGWTPREKESVIAMQKRIKERAQHTLRSKLKRDVRRAQSRLTEGTGKKTSLQRRKQVLKAFDQIVKKGEITKAKLTEKQQEALKSRVARAHVKAEKSGAKILGKLSGSLFSTVTEDTLTITSRPDWSSVHNDGGTAGNGAKISKRTFLEWTPERLAKIGKILTYGFVTSWNEGENQSK